MESSRSALNILKGLLIVLVVVGHFGQTIANSLPESYAFIGHGVVLFIYSFHMPLFLFVSGFLSKNEEKRRQKAFESLLFPYLVFQLFVGICTLILTRSGEVLRNILIPQLGAWYLLTLFSYRLVLPEIKRIRGILVFGVLFSVFACLMNGFGNAFAIQKTMGFFVFFMLGYKMAELPNKKINKVVARCLLFVVFAVILFVTWKTEWYSVALSVLSRNADTNSFSHWYYAPIAYLIVFLISSLMMILIINSLPNQCKWLEKQGTDTMPMYLSHLIVFMAVGYMLNKSNWIVTVGLCFAFMVISLVVFSSKWYRNLFNNCFDGIKKAIMQE